MKTNRAFAAAWIVVVTWLGMLGGANSAADPQARPGKLRVYFGTGAGGSSKGIYRAELDLATGQLSAASMAAELFSPSFLAIHPSQTYLYAVTQIDDGQGKRVGGVAALAIDRDSGDLKLLNRQASGGGGPCHVVVDKAGAHVLVANYGGGSVAALPIGKDGQLSVASAVVQHQGSSVNKQRQEAPHAHSINLDPANRFAFAADLGLY